MTQDVLTRIEGPAKLYPNTLQKLAKHFWRAYQHCNILEFADELERSSDIAVVCVTDDQHRPIGIIRREKLFLSLSRRFGREIMSKYTVLDCVEKAPVYPGQSNILLVHEFRRKNSENPHNADSIPSENSGYIVLADSNGFFCGMLSFQDIADYMAELTNDDIALASLLQGRFLANADNVRSFGINAEAWWSSAKGVGGDFYFIKKITENRFFASLCDVSGKGIAAALVVSMVWGFLRAHAMHCGLGDLIASLNESIVDSFHLEKYLTGFFMIYDKDERSIRLADMGHAHTLFLRKGQILSLKETRRNLPIGVEQNIEPVIYGLRVQSGDALLIYSDGIPEQDDPDGREFGEERIIVLAKQAVEKGEKLSEILPLALAEFRRHTPQRDDMTFLLFRF